MWPTDLAIDPVAALWFAPLAVPLCLFVIWTDMARMKIHNKTVLMLAAVFVVLGPLALDLPTYGWRLATLLIVLVAGILVSGAGFVGAGDAKFAAAAAPFIAPADAMPVLVLLGIMLIAAYATHRVVRATSLRRLAPGWESWSRDKDFPMGMALGGTLAVYLVLGAL